MYAIRSYYVLLKGRHLFKTNGKQIAVFAGEAGVFACNNRCPHEGYPLNVASLSGTRNNFV